MIPSKPATNLEQLHFFELFLAKRNLEPFYTKIYNSFSKGKLKNIEVVFAGQTGN